VKRGTPDHPKARALALKLGLRRFEIVGLLESLWHFAAGYARRGDLGRFSDLEIAEHLGWEPGSHESLIRALVETRWLDRCQCHRLRVHDWPDHADQTVSRSVRGSFLECYGDSSGRLVTDSVIANVADLPLPLPLPEPIPEPKPLPGPIGDQSNGPRRNPLMVDRPKWETRWHEAVTLLSRLQDRDPAEVAAEHSRYPGGRTSKLNPASMTEDRLMQTVMSLESAIKAAQSNRPPPSDMQSVCQNAGKLVDEFLEWRLKQNNQEVLGAALGRWRELRGISFEASAAAGLLRLADERMGAA
jgi:hypothetical protein